MSGRVVFYPCCDVIKKLRRFLEKCAHIPPSNLRRFLQRHAQVFLYATCGMSQDMLSCLRLCHDILPHSTRHASSRNSRSAMLPDKKQQEAEPREGFRLLLCLAFPCGLQSVGSQDENQQTEDSVELGEHGEHHGGTECVVTSTDSADTVSANLSLTDS